MGVGDSLDATYTLTGEVAAGDLTLVGDGVVTGDAVEAMDVQWDLYLRGPDDTTTPVLLARFDASYQRNPNARFDAVRYEATQALLTGGGKTGDRLTLRITPQTGGPNAFFLPNGDGALTKGRIPHLQLP